MEMLIVGEKPIHKDDNGGTIYNIKKMQLTFDF